MNFFGTIYRAAVVLLGVALMSGCAANVPSGKWLTDPRVQQAFEAGTILPDHTYYYLGSLAAPDSVIAIDNRFTLRTRVWAQVDITQEMIDGWLSWFQVYHSSRCTDYGGVILTPDGRQVGIWYSQNIINTVRMPEPGVIEVFQPHSISGRTCERANDDHEDRGALHRWH